MRSIFLLSRTVNIIILFILFAGTNIFPADKDNLKSENSIIPYILPLTLTVIGSSISGSVFEKDLQSDIRNSLAEDYYFGIDDYIQYSPVAEIYIFKACGLRSKNNFWQMTKYLGIANLTSGALVLGLKRATDKTRPNGSKYSFPSGHTNFTFTNATVLYHEYKDSNKLAAYSGYAFAATTGVFRILNNRHWLSDVLAGAGLGILVSNMVYQFEPLKNFHPFGLGAEKNLTVLPIYGDELYGLSLHFDLSGIY